MNTALKFTSFLTIALIAINFSSCKKDEVEEPTPEEPVVELDPCAGDDGFCMDYGTVNKSGPASLFVYNQSKIRVFWEEGEGTTFEQVELDVYGLVAGTYDVNDLAISGSSAFIQYYSAAGGTVNAEYGTVVVSALDTNGVVTGTFTATMKDSTKITNGKFTNISK